MKYKQEPGKRMDAHKKKMHKGTEQRVMASAKELQNLQAHATNHKKLKKHKEVGMKAHGKAPLRQHQMLAQGLMHKKLASKTKQHEPKGKGLSEKHKHLKMAMKKHKTAHKC